MWTMRVRVWVAFVCAFAGRAQGANLTYGLDREGQNLCMLGLSTANEYWCHDYNRTDWHYLIDYKNSGHFKVICIEKRPVLEFGVLPRFVSEPLGVGTVILKNCPPPHNRSFEQVLATFNVNVNLLTELKLLKLPQEPQLTEDHFSGIEHLEKLEITGSKPPDRPKPAAHFLAKLRSLRSLDLENVLLQPGKLNNLTTTLQQLRLKDTDVQQLPASVFELTNLTKLTLLEGQIKILWNSKLQQNLTDLYINLKESNINLDKILFNLPISILTLEVWNETLPAALTSCNHLQNLQLNKNSALKLLPDLWLSKCSSLQKLSVKNAKNLKSLPENLLQGAKALIYITLMNNALETLPKKLFYGLYNLISLELQDNKLLTIPSELFAESPALGVLNLESNNLTGDDVWKALEPLHALTILNIAYNTRLGDACVEINGYSSLNKSENLTEFILTGTNITRICRDWREDMTLLTSLHLDNTSISVLRHDDVVYILELANNNISMLRGAELHPRNAEQSSNTPQLEHHFRELNLTNNSLVGVDESAVILIARQRPLVHLANNSLVCNCSLAPLLRALSGRNQSNATCADGSALDAAPTVDCPFVPPAAWLAAALLALVAGAALGVACFANRHWRLTLYVILYKLRLMGRTVERDDDCLFDAFISYSPEDEGVLSQIVNWLESRPTPYRLCLDYRDWVPGPFISNQIVASVRRSRRTVVLVSRHFLESEYARDEFRQAYALAMSEVTPRLVVVLLEDPATLPLDARLRRYLRFNTYLRWGDMWFWDKLELALPIPRSQVQEQSRRPAPVSPRPPPVSPATLAAPVAPLVCCCWSSRSQRPLSADQQLETINLNTSPSASIENLSPTNADLHASSALTDISPETSGGLRGVGGVASDSRPDENGVCGADADPLASGRERSAGQRGSERRRPPHPLDLTALLQLFRSKNIPDETFKNTYYRNLPES